MLPRNKTRNIKYEGGGIDLEQLYFYMIVFNQFDLLIIAHSIQGFHDQKGETAGKD